MGSAGRPRSPDSNRSDVHMAAAAHKRMVCEFGLWAVTTTPPDAGGDTRRPAHGRSGAACYSAEMAVVAIAFDTHRFVKRLTGAGMGRAASGGPGRRAGRPAERQPRHQGRTRRGRGKSPSEDHAGGGQNRGGRGQTRGEDRDGGSEPPPLDGRHPDCPGRRDRRAPSAVVLIRTGTVSPPPAPHRSRCRPRRARRRTLPPDQEKGRVQTWSAQRSRPSFRCSRC